MDYTCKEHPYIPVRDGECLECRPIETINLHQAAPYPGILASIATHLEMWGKVTIINSAIAEHPGFSALLLGKQFAEAEAEKRCDIVPSS